MQQCILRRLLLALVTLCVLDTFFCLGGFGSYRRLWTYNAVHFSEVH